MFGDNIIPLAIFYFEFKCSTAPNKKLINEFDTCTDHNIVHLSFYNLKQIYRGIRDYNDPIFSRDILEDKNYAYFYKLLTASSFVSSNLFKKYFQVHSDQIMHIKINVNSWVDLYEVIDMQHIDYIKNILDKERSINNKVMLIIAVDILNYLVDRHHISGNTDINLEIKELFKEIVYLQLDCASIIKHLIQCIEKVWGHPTETYFLSLSKLQDTMFRLNETELKIIFNTEIYDEDIFNVLYFLCFIDTYNVEIDLGCYSTGEYNLLLQISMLHDLCSYKTERTIILFLDEYEQHLHPEWSRKYLSYLLEFLDMEGSQYDIKFQVILVTHSPYLISDLPKENIILLEKDEKTGKRTARKSNYGFASNYYDIMSDSFFLDDTIGEFAKQKINQVIKRLNSLSNLLDKKEFRSKKVSNKFMQQSQLILGHVNPIIELIGDPFIKQQLDRMVMSIDERLKASCQPESKKELLEKQRAILEAQIKQIDQELGND